MAFAIQESTDRVVLHLSGGVTARDVGALASGLAPHLRTGTAVLLHTGDLEDIDTSVLQLLISLRKTAVLMVENPSDVLVAAADRCSLRGELLGGGKD